MDIHVARYNSGNAFDFAERPVNVEAHFSTGKSWESWLYGWSNARSQPNGYSKWNMEHKKHLHPKTNSCVLIWCVAPSRVPNSGKILSILQTHPPGDSKWPVGPLVGGHQRRHWNGHWTHPLIKKKNGLNHHTVTIEQFLILCWNMLEFGWPPGLICLEPGSSRLLHPSHLLPQVQLAGGSHWNMICFFVPLFCLTSIYVRLIWSQWSSLKKKGSRGIADVKMSSTSGGGFRADSASCPRMFVAK